MREAIWLAITTEAPAGSDLLRQKRFRQSAQAKLKGGVVLKRRGQAPAGSEVLGQKCFRQSAQELLLRQGT